MSLVKWAFIGLLVLPAAELVAFLLAAALIGWLKAGALLVATSVVGALVLRRSGRGDLGRLRAAFQRDGIQAIHLETPGMATLLGGILLVFPGFITDVLGAALFLPAARRWAAGKLARARRARRRDDRVIDLEPGEWQQISDHKRGRRRPSKGGADKGSKRGA
jgi:UPF0716 protein FxsA